MCVELLLLVQQAAGDTRSMKHKTLAAGAEESTQTVRSVPTCLSHAYVYSAKPTQSMYTHNTTIPSKNIAKYRPVTHRNATKMCFGGGGLSSMTTQNSVVGFALHIIARVRFLSPGV